MFCKYCGNKVNDGAAVCSSCGMSAEGHKFRQTDPWRMNDTDNYADQRSNKSVSAKPSHQKALKTKAISFWIVFAIKILVIFNIFAVLLSTVSYTVTTFFDDLDFDIVCLVCSSLLLLASVAAFIFSFSDRNKGFIKKENNLNCLLILISCFLYFLLILFAFINLR